MKYFLFSRDMYQRVNNYDEDKAIRVIQWAVASDLPDIDLIPDTT